VLEVRGVDFECLDNNSVDGFATQLESAPTVASICSLQKLGNSIVETGYLGTSAEGALSAAIAVKSRHCVDPVKMQRRQRELRQIITCILSNEKT
jgi:hypothetical protein